MVARGRVQSGVVVLDEGVWLPEGLEVTVITPEPSAKFSKGRGPHSVLDIAAVSLGTMLRPLTRDDELFDEMLEGRA